MVVKTAVALSEWVFNDIIGETKNKSRRIEELIIKGYMAEKEQNLKKSMNSKDHDGLIAQLGYTLLPFLDQSFALLET